MSDEPKRISEWARKRAAGKARRERMTRRREAYFDLLVSGYSVAEIATATKTHPSSVRRGIAQALAERQPHAQEDFVQLQVVRLNKALRCADMTLERGDMTAIGPYLQVVAELNRFHGLDAAAPLKLAAPKGASGRARAPEPPLALTHTPSVSTLEAPVRVTRSQTLVQHEAPEI